MYTLDVKRITWNQAGSLFASSLSHLLGFRPRIRDLADKRLYVQGNPAQWPALSSMIRGSINTKIIGQQLGEVLGLASSIQQGTVIDDEILNHTMPLYRKHNQSVRQVPFRRKPDA